MKTETLLKKIPLTGNTNINMHKRLNKKNHSLFQKKVVSSQNSSSNNIIEGFVAGCCIK